MADIEKGRIQRDAQRAVAGRRTVGTTQAEQAVLRHLSIELYRERRRSVDAPDEQDDMPAANGTSKE